MKKFIFILIIAFTAQFVNAQNYRVPKINPEVQEMRAEQRALYTERLGEGINVFPKANSNKAQLQAFGSENRFNTMEQRNDSKAPSTGLLNETFETILPNGWIIEPESGVTYNNGSPVLIPTWTYPGWYYNEAPEIDGDNNYIIFLATLLLDFTGSGYPNIASLITPALEPTAENHILSYRAIEIYDGNPAYLDDGIELYVEVSTDNGISWTQSNDNVMLQVPNHNEAGDNHYADLTIDLSSYVGSVIYVRFRAVSDYGGFVLALDNISGVPRSIPDERELEMVQVGTGVDLYTPIRQAREVLPMAWVRNNGTAMDAEETLIFTVNPGTYIKNVTLTEIGELETTMFEVPEGEGFTPTEINEYTVTAIANVVDENLLNNSSSTTFNISQNTFSTVNDEDREYVVGTGNNTGSVGNLFELVQEDVISSFNITFAATSQGLPEINFSVSIYSFDAEDGTVTEIYTSDEFTRTLSMHLVDTKFNIEPQLLPAGTYFFGVNQLTANVDTQVLADGLASGLYYVTFSGDDILYYENRYGSLYVKVNTSQVVSVSPANNSENVAINAGVTVTLFDNIVEGDFSGITIVDDENNQVNLNVTFENNILTIGHDAFEYSTEYTVTVPVTAIDGLWEEITWSFTTQQPPLAVIEYTPEEDATDIIRNAVVSVEFNRAITAADLSGVTITYEPSGVVGNLNASIEGAILSIAHDDFIYETEYTVTIPAGAIEEYSTPISWTFTTEEEPMQLASINSTSWDAGEVEIDRPATSVSFILTNEGGRTLTVSDITSLSSPWSSTFGDPAAVTLTSGQSHTFTFTFAPNDPVDYSENFVITTNGGTITIALSGAGLRAEAGITRTSWDAGEVLVGSSLQSPDFMLTNTGTGTLRFSDITSLSSPWSCTFDDITGLELTPGESQIFTFTFAPTDILDYPESFIITTNVGTTTIQLSGTGINPIPSLNTEIWNAGEIETGNTETSSNFVLTNTGTTTLTVSSITELAAPWSSTFGDITDFELEAGVSHTFTFSFAPTTAGHFTENFEITTNGGVVEVELIGTGVQPIAGINPELWAAGEIIVGSTETSGSFTLTNDGTGTLLVSGITTLTAPWSSTFGDISEVSLEEGEFHTFQFTFAPTATGDFNETFEITTNGGNKTITLSGTGVQPIATISSDSWNAGEVTVGQSETSGSYTLTNTGTGVLTVSEITQLSTPWTTSFNNIGEIELEEGDYYEFTFAFNPSVTGPVTQNFVITTNAGAKTIALSGTGVQPTASISSEIWDAGEIVVGNTETSANYTLTNTGSGDLTVSAITQLSAPWASTFGNISSISLGAGESHTFKFSFTPTTGGNFTESFVITTNGGTKTISLSGKGLKPELEISSLSWDAGNVVINKTGTSPEYKLKNIGTSTLTVSNITELTSPWETSFDPQEVSLAAGEEYVFTFTFAPTELGEKEINFVITTNGGNGTIALKGEGIDNISVPSVNANEINIYPNPSNGIVNITVSENSLAKIIDVTGKLLSTEKVMPNSALTLNLSAGIYYIQIESNGNVSNHKVVIQ